MSVSLNTLNSLNNDCFSIYTTFRAKYDESVTFSKKYQHVQIVLDHLEVPAEFIIENKES